MQTISVRYTGAFQDASGYASAARSFVTSLHLAGVDTTTELAVHMKEHTHYGWEGELCYQLQDRNIPYKVKILHVTPDMYESYMEPKKYHIVRLAWETDRLPKGWDRFCNQMGELWTSSPHMIELFKRSGVKVPMYAFPEPIDVTMGDKNYGKFSVPTHQGFLFYSIFQWIERKNPRALLKAYWKAFQGKDDVTLLIKTFRLSYDDDERRRIRNDIILWKNEMGEGKWPRVLVSFDLLDQEGIMKLHQTGECFVLGHRGEGWCLVPETQIVTNKGIVPIEECNKKEVLTQSGNFYEAKLLSRDYEGEVIEINPYYTNNITLTPNHEVLVIKRRGKEKLSYIKKDKPQWIRADEIEKGDFVCFPKVKDRDKSLDKIRLSDFFDDFIIDGERVYLKGRNQSGEFKHGTAFNITNDVEIDGDILFLFGLFLAEGCTRNGRSLVFSLNQKEENLINEIMRISTIKFNIVPTLEFLERNRVNVCINSKILGRIFKLWFLSGAENKEMPSWMLCLDDFRTSRLIDGMWKGDGSVYSESNCLVGSYSTVSKKLAWQLYLLMTKIINDPISISRKKRKFGKDEYVIKIKGEENKRRLKFLFPFLEKISPKRKYGWGDENYLFLMVQSINKKKYKGKVFNLFVEKDNTYVTEGFLVHNCRPVQEALLMGKPVISTALGGIHEYLRPEHYFGLESKMVSVKEVPYIKFYTSDQMWAEVDEKQLIKAMQFVYANKELATSKGVIAKDFIKDQFSYHKIGEKMRMRLQDIYRSL